MNIQNIVVDQETIKALSIKSRIDMLELIHEKPRTMSEISEELSLKPSTVSEHLKKLESAGLVKKEETDRKWKYFYLTEKSKKILNPYETKVVFALFSSLFLTLFSAFQLFTRNMFAAKATYTDISSKSYAQMEAIKAVQTNTVSRTIFTPEFIWFILFLLGLTIVAASVTYTMYKIRIKKNLGKENRDE